MTRRGLVAAGALLVALSPLPAAAQGRGLELQAGAFSTSARRSAAFDGSVGTGSGAMHGIEVSLGVRLVRLSGRYFGGSFAPNSGGEAAGRIRTSQVRVLLGPPVLAADLGLSRRGFTGTLGTRAWTYARVGGRVSLPLGATGLRADVGLAYLGEVGAAGQAGSGRDAETRLTFDPRSLPLYVGIGYRHERFTIRDASGERAEEITGILLAAGARLGF